MRIDFRTKFWDKPTFSYIHMTLYGHVPEISVFEQIFNEKPIGNHMNSLYRQNMRNFRTNREE